MLIGAHVSAAGGFFNAPANAALQGCECYQFFSRPPQGGPAKKIMPGDILKFKLANQKLGFKNFYLHAPYFVNLASVKNSIRYGSISILRQELERGSLLGVKYLMTHLGSGKNLTKEASLQKTISSLQKILTGYKGYTKFLIEISAGSGDIIGATFEEISYLINHAGPVIQKKIGVCFDTAHAFESGYDLRNAPAVNKTLTAFDQIIGLEKIKLIHINDSKTELGSHIDRHADLGDGAIGLTGFDALIDYLQKKKNDVDLILETPDQTNRPRDIQILKNIRAKK